MSEILLPCPFCGGEGDDSMELCANLIQCLECSARGPAQDGPEFACSAHLAVTEWNRRAERTRALSQLEAGAGDVSDQAQFLLDRLSELEWSDIPHDFWRDWNGHVEPAIARLRSALASPSPAPESEPVDEGGHVWHEKVFSSMKVKCCMNCGFIFNEDQPNKPCPGPIGVTMRGTPTPAVDADAVIEAAWKPGKRKWHKYPLYIEEWFGGKFALRVHHKVAGVESTWAEFGSLSEAVAYAERWPLPEYAALSLPPSVDKGE